LKNLILPLFLAVASRAYGGPAPAIDFTHDRWSAFWIRVPVSDPNAYGVYHFRKQFDLAAVPPSLKVFVSADNRYQLFLNGELISVGPARSDLFHWRYEIVDLAPNLHPGRNVLAAVVWNEGVGRAIAQNSIGTGFLLQAEDAAFRILDTNTLWRCAPDQAYHPQVIPKEQLLDYTALGPNEHLEGSSYPWGWETSGFNDQSWSPAQLVTAASPRLARDGPNGWMLVPAGIPEEKREILRLSRIRRARGVQVDPDFLKGGHAFTVGAHAEATLLLDQDFLTTAFPRLTVSGGARSEIRLRYAETLYDQVRPVVRKTDRNDVEGKIFVGRFDAFLPDGGAHRRYQPLFWRTYRYLELDITTGDEPVIVEDLDGLSTGYPFEQRASIHFSDLKLDEQIQKILNTGWRTARLCAHETYMDCPYYEQLQYVGDARIQMLVSLYNSGDARLMRKAIEDIDASRTAEGATYSRAPSSLPQYIPPFSLWWIGIMHDYWMYVDDPDFVRTMLPGVESILRFFARYQMPTGSLRKLPWWNFVDWTATWPSGEAPADPDGSSAAAIDLQLVLAYDWAADLEKAFGDELLSDRYRKAAAHLRETVRVTDWDGSRRIFADQPSHRTYSQQVNTLAVLADVLPKSQSRDVLLKALADPTLEHSSIYFQAYTNAALAKVGEGARYVDRLGPWLHMLQQGLTTWAEVDEPSTRSDCHGWGASPNIEIYRTVAGVTPETPGFRSVRIEPNLVGASDLQAVIPHPGGEIEIRISGVKAEVTLPPGVPGKFIWKGKTYVLRPGQNRLSL
jgi:hypothetical protein